MPKTPSGLSTKEAEEKSKKQKIILPSTGGLFKVQGSGGQWQIGFMKDDIPCWLTSQPKDGNWGGKTQAEWRKQANAEFLSQSGLSFNEMTTINLADFNAELARKHAGPGMNIQQSLAKAPQKNVNLEEFVQAIGGKFEEAAQKETEQVSSVKESGTLASTQPVQKSLISIWGERPDLQAEFPDPLGQGVSGNWTINDWWNQYGQKEMSDVQLIQPDQEAVKTAQGGAGVDSTAGMPNSNITPTTGGQAGIGDNTGTSISNQEFSDYLTSMGIDPNQLDPNTLAMASIAYESMKTMEQSGQVIDPELEISETNALDFLSELEKNPLTNKTFLEFAQKELGPYYQQQIDFAKQDLTRGLQNIERQYGKGMEQIGEESAESGLAYSGRRIKAENELAEESVRQAGTIGRQYERQAGSSSLSGVSIPKVGGLPLYSLSGDIEGELEKEKETQEKLYAQDIESVYRQRKALRNYT